MYLHNSTNFVWFQGASANSSDDDQRGFAAFTSAMKVLTFTDQQVQDILRVLAAILHLGNLLFRSKLIGKVIGN